MFLSRSDNSFGPGTRNASKRLSGGSKNQIFGPDSKIVRAPCFWAVLTIVLDQEPEMLQTAFWKFQKLDIWSRPKNRSRAKFLNRSGNSFGPGTRNASKHFSGGSKNQIFALDLKIARALCFWAVLAIVLGQEPEILQNGFLEVPKTTYSVQTQK